MTKEQLELKVKELTAALAQFQTDQQELTKQLNQAKEDLEDVNKPVITKEIRDEMRTQVYEAISNFSFDNVDSYEYDFEINYNNQIELSNLQFNYTDDLEESVCDYVESVFKVEGDDED
jgi:chromosome condensin MukBEF ATPase and DNA-binding subunit MukB